MKITAAEPRIYKFDEVTSTLDVAREMCQKGELGLWESVLAGKQTQGRGQLRRPWVSPPGGLFVAWRLPCETPFSGDAAPIIVGIFCAQALAKYGYDLKLKWPNDLILKTAAGYGKCGGILLEEHGKCLLAGIGINIINAPQAEQMDRAGYFRSASLAEAGIEPPGCGQLWQTIVETGIKFSADKQFVHEWQKIVNDLLFWRDQCVRMLDGDKEIRGNLQGLDQHGRPILATVDGLVTPIGNELQIC